MHPRKYILFVLLTALPVQAQTDSVYSDALGAGWDNWSWSGTYTFSNGSPIHVGTASIRCDQDGWGGLSLRHAAIASNAYQYLEFYIHGGTTGGQLLDVFLENDSSQPCSGTVNVEDYIVGGGGVVAGAWRQVSIPLTALPVTQASFTRVDIRNRTGDAITYYLDDITLRQTATAPPVVRSVRAANQLTVIAFFDTGLTTNSASSTGNYELLSGTDAHYATRKKPAAANYDSARWRVALTFTNDFLTGARYTLYVNHVTNLAGVAIAPDTGGSFGLSNHTVQVNAFAQVHPISPLIYGLSWAPSTNYLADIGATVNRWGGNHSSTYNWVSNAFNTANDWYFENNNWAANLDAYRPYSNAVVFANSMAAAGVNPVLTVPLLPYVAKNHTSVSFSVAKYGPQEDTDPYRPDAGNGISTNGQPIVNNPLDSGMTNTVGIQAQWLRHILSNAPAPAFFACDNEMDIWGSTHRDWHPAAVTYNEMWNVFTNFAIMARTESPQSQILAPVSCCWWYYWNSAAGGDDKTAHGGEDFLPWFLDKAAQYEQQSGQRLLDYLDIHYYPDTFWNAGTDVTNAAVRLRGTRDLWDPTYKNEGWIGDDQWATQTQPNRNYVQLIPRFKTLIAQHYPSTKLALTEWNWGADTTLNGALALADVLGILGREDLDLATYWTCPNADSPAYQAFKLYRNFGNISIAATTNDPNLFAAYAAKDATDVLTLIVINKNPAFDYSTALQFTNYIPAPTATVYQVSSANLSAILQEPDILNATTNFNFIFPAYSATLLQFTPADTDADGMPDFWEQTNGLNRLDPADANSDADGDGFTNRQESLAGTNPQSPDSALRIIDVTPTGLISFSTASNKFYRVEHCDDLATGEWLPLTNNIPGTGSLLEIQDPTATIAPQRFYRARLLP